MANQRSKPEESVTKLRQVEVLTGQGIPRLGAIRQIGVTEQTYYRWKKNRDLVRHWFENNGRERYGHRSIEGTEASAERERAAEKGCV